MPRRPTTAERLKAAIAHDKEQLEQTARELRAKESALRAEETAERNKRRFLVGKLADNAGLFALSDADLEALFQALSPLAAVPSPAAVLTAALQDIKGASGTSVDASGHAAHDVSPACSV